MSALKNKKILSYPVDFAGTLLEFIWKEEIFLNGVLLTALESIMIVTALSMDAFVASFAYGANKVKIPFSSVTAINVICSSILAISLFFGSIISNFIPEAITHIICFLILFILGLAKTGESIVHWISQKRENLRKNIKISFKIYNKKVILLFIYKFVYKKYIKISIILVNILYI